MSNAMTYIARPLLYMWDTLHYPMRDVFQGATPENAVRMREQTGSGPTNILPYMFPLPAWEGVEKEYDVRDFALLDALHTMCEDWSEFNLIPLSDVVSRMASLGY